MSPFSLFRIINRGRSQLRRKNTATIIVMSVFILLALLIAIGEYFGFSYFINTLGETEEFKMTVISYSFHSLYAVIFALMLASSIIMSPILFLKSKDDNYLLSLPIKTTTLFTARLYSQILMVSWPAIIFGLPATLALGIQTHQPVFFYLLAFFFLIIFIIMSVAISNIILFTIITLTRSTRSYFTTLLSLISIGFIFYALISTVTPHNLVTLLVGQTTNENREAWQDLTKQFQYWPSTFYAETLINPVLSKTVLGLNSFILLFVTAILACIQFLIAKLTYRRSLQLTQESNERRISHKGILSKLSGNKIYPIKVWILLWREKSDRNQFFLFLFLFILYVGFIFNSPNLSTDPDPTWTPRIIFFILITISYFTVLLALRFAFPFGSSEKHKTWFNLTLPTVREHAFGAHILAIFLPMALIIEIIILMTSQALHFSNDFTYPLLIISPILCLTNTVLAAGLGVMIPVKYNTSAESMSTSLSGLLTFLLCVVYSTSMTTLIWLEAKNMIDSGKIGINFGIDYSLGIVLSVIVILFFWYLGKRSYTRMLL